MSKHLLSATILADSGNPDGDRLTTFLLRFPRMLLAEFNTHRSLSRNTASSRAIPFDKMLAVLRENPFIPWHWPAEQSGMQGNLQEQINGATKAMAYNTWVWALQSVDFKAVRLSALGIHRSIPNRLLEPFMWVEVIATGDNLAWEHFFQLRGPVVRDGATVLEYGAAEPHFQDLTALMMETYEASQPAGLYWGEWHIPFRLPPSRTKWEIAEQLVESASRCAAISYGRQQDSEPYEKHLKRHDKLIMSRHASPFEHQAKACSGQFRNFHGWRQYRDTLGL